ncbi:Thioredoxin domain [Dillenia turbinata]|uniref:Thioredoxin domain n=1 Tax=Dillenia turbinata TaxID=194707 RepID=A0AAN8UZZ4_9MAGN
MACSLRSGGSCSNSGFEEIRLKNQFKGVLGFGTCVCSLSFSDSKSRPLPVLRREFLGRPLVVLDQKGLFGWEIRNSGSLLVHAQLTGSFCKAMRWWDKSLKPNMIEVHSAQHLVDSLLNAGDNLVIVDFYSPGCGGCKALHPKICQFAEMNPDALFLKVNYEELKPMCYALHVHVLPFFRFYRGAQGKVCSFSCTVATIKKFKDALAKYGGEKCSTGPAKGLDESELLKLAASGQISIDLPLPYPKEDLLIKSLELSNPMTKSSPLLELNQENVVLKV